MSKLLPTLFAVILIVLIGGAVALSFMDVQAPTQKIENTVTYDDFKAKG